MIIVFLPLIVGLAVSLLVVVIIYQRKIKTQYKKIQILLGQKKKADLVKPEPMSKLEEKMWYEEEISFIFKLIERLSLSLNKDEIARYIVQEAWQFLDVEQCVLILFDESTGMLKIKSAIGLKEDTVGNYCFKKGESVSGWVMKNNEPLIINNLDNESWFKKINKEEYLKKSFISVPLSFEHKALGVISVCNKKTGEVFTKEDLKFLINVARVGAVAFQNVCLHEQMQESYLRTIAALAAAIDAKDPYTKMHSENVTRYSLAIAKQMGCSLTEVETIRRAGLLHDIGKIGIKDGILLKHERLTPEEFKQMKLHSQKGEAIVKSLSFLKEVAILIRHHHERYDGQGYPDGLSGQSVELGARILSVADAFDTMTTDRPYRKRLSLEQAKDELKKNQGTQFDTEVVENFLRILEQDSHIVKDY